MQNRTSKTTNPSLVKRAAGVIQHGINLAAIIAVAMLCALGYSAHAEEANSAADADTTASSTAPKTNSPVAQIQRELEQIKAQVEASVKQLQAAVASNSAQRAERVSKLAAEIRDLGTKDLGDESKILKGADALIAKMRASVAKARALSTDPKIEARDAYAAVLLRLEPELAKLIDAKSSVAKIRAELFRQAESLQANADAIAFADDADQDIVASATFRRALSDVVEFARRLELLINQVGSGRRVQPIT